MLTCISSKKYLINKISILVFKIVNRDVKPVKKIYFKYSSYLISFLFSFKKTFFSLTVNNIKIKKIVKFAIQ